MIHPHDPQAAMNAKYAAFARKDADTARRLQSDPAGRSELVSLAARLLHLRTFLDDDPHDEELRRVAARLRKLANGAAPRASQAAGDANGARDDAGAAHGGDGAAAGRTALRDRIRDALHTINPDCVAYHAADCIDCTMRADAVMAEMRAELDAKDAEIAWLREQIAYYNRRWHQAMDDGDDKFLWVLQERSRAVSAERRSDRYRTAWESARRGRRSWRQRAEAAEAEAAKQTADADRLDQLLIDERAITARLNRELGRLRDQNGHQP